MGVRGKRERPTRQMLKAEMRWRGLLADQRASGRGLEEFCRERGINKVMFYRWRKRLRGACAASEESAAVAATPAATLVPVRLTSNPGAGWGIEIQFPAGHVLRIGRGVDADVIATVLATMRAVAC